MALRLNDDYRNTILNNGYNNIQANTELRIYTGSQPASANDAASGTLLVAISLPATAFTNADPAGSPIQLTKTGTWSGTAVATGVAGYFRLIHMGNDLRLDGAVTATAGGGELELDSTTIADGSTVSITQFDMIQPAGSGDFKLSDGAAADLLNVGLEAAFNGGQMAIFQGTLPTDANTVTAEVKLLEFTLPADALNIAPAGQTGRVTKNGTWQGTVSTGGTAAFFRITDVDSLTEEDLINSPNARIQGSVAVASATLLLTDINLLLNGSVTIDTFNVDKPAS